MDRLFKFADFLEKSAPGGLANRILEYFGLDLPPFVIVPALIVFTVLFLVYVFVPLIKVLFALFSALVSFILYSRVKGSGLTGRFATFWEIWRQFTIASRPSYFLLNFFILPASMVFFTLSAIIGLGYMRNGVMDLDLFRNMPLIAVIAAASWVAGIFLFRRRSYSKIMSEAQPFPLGKYKLMDINLIGGVRKSLLKGTVKDQRQEHVLMIGPTGSGKTTCFFVPPIINDAFGYASSVFIEVKSASQDNIFDIVAPVWNRQGKKVMIFDPWSGGPTLHFNPLLLLKPDFKDVTTVNLSKLFVSALYETAWAEQGRRPGVDTHFIQQEHDLIRPLMILMQFKPMNMRNFAAIREIVSGTVDDVSSFIKSVVSFSSKEIAEDIRKELSWFTSEENMRRDRKAEILTSIRSILDVYSSPNIRACTTDHNLDLDLIFKEPCLLCLRAPLNEKGASTIPSMIVRLLMMKSYNKQIYGAGDDFKVWFYMDELASLAISSLPRFVQTARSAGVGIIAGIQAKSDLLSVVDPRMGALGIDSIIPNFKTQIIFPGIDLDTAKYFSQFLGKKEVVTQSAQRHVFDLISFRYSQQAQQVPLASEASLTYMDDKFMRTKKNVALVKSAHVRPFFVKTIPWYTKRKYKKWANAGKPEIYMPELQGVIFQSPDIPRYQTHDEKATSKKPGLNERLMQDMSVEPKPCFEPNDAPIERSDRNIPDGAGQKRVEKAKNEADASKAHIVADEM